VSILAKTSLWFHVYSFTDQALDWQHYDLFWGQYNSPRAKHSPIFVANTNWYLDKDEVLHMGRFETHSKKRQRYHIFDDGNLDVHDGPENFYARNDPVSIHNVVMSEKKDLNKQFMDLNFGMFFYY
jgi:hypothetical protein